MAVRIRHEEDLNKDFNTKDLETYIVYLNLDTKDRVACPHNQVYPHIKPVPYQICRV